MYVFKSVRIQWLFRYPGKQFAPLNCLSPTTGLIFSCKCNFNGFRSYCSDLPIVLKNQSLAKYFVNLLEEFQRHKGGKFKGMDPDHVQRKLEIVKNLVNQINIADKNIKSLNELRTEGVQDEFFIKSLDNELKEHEKVMEDAEDAIVSELLPKDEKESCDNIMFEVTAGVGGQEAMLFAQDLHKMYCSYLEFKNWDFELSDLEQSEIGGLKHSSMMISGKNCYKLLRYEGGVHRVQRIPKTEKYGRLQTSTATVAILPQPTEVEVKINDKDLRIETKTSRGPGGQHVNKIETAVRIHHLPTGIIVDCQVHKSQYQNRKLALQKLRSKLYQIECEQQDSKLKNLRKFQIGTASRNEKVRTYNFLQDRITDHRFNKTIHNLERYFLGNEHFDNFLQSLLEIHYDQEKTQFLNQLQSTYN